MMLGGRAKKINNTITKLLLNVANIQGANNYQQPNSNRKSAITIGSLIDHKAYTTGSKRKLLHNTKLQPVQVKNSPIQRGITRDKQPRELALKAALIIQR